MKATLPMGAILIGFLLSLTVSCLSMLRNVNYAVIVVVLVVVWKSMKKGKIVFEGFSVVTQHTYINRNVVSVVAKKRYHFGVLRLDDVRRLTFDVFRVKVLMLNDVTLKMRFFFAPH
jgi:hypothetical protein